jgi:hypothetical protein
MSVTFDYFPFNTGLGEDSYEDRWRAIISTMRSNGVVVAGRFMSQPTGATPNDLCVFTDPGNLRVRVGYGTAFINGQMFQAITNNASPQYTLLDVEPNLGGSPRTDLVVARANYAESTITYLILLDTNEPVIDANTYDIPLAQLTVPPSATEIIQSNILDRRVSSNQATFAPMLIARRIVDLAIPAGSGVNTDPTIIPWTTIERGNMFMRDPDDNTIINIKETGVYDIKCTIAWDGTMGDTTLRKITIFRESEGVTTSISQASVVTSGINTVSVICNATRTIELSQFDKIYVGAYNYNLSNATEIIFEGNYSPIISVIKIADSVGIEN